MANKKIKHIIAKLVGSSTEETMDVYDVDAVHTSDVINNLTSNTEAAKKKPLSAYQGYVLNNNLTKRFIIGSVTDQIRYGFGWVTSGGARLNIVMPAPIETSVSTVSVSSMKISMRIPGGGYIIEDNTDITSYLETVTVTLQGFVFIFYKSDGWGVPNNTPVTGGINISLTMS